MLRFLRNAAFPICAALAILVAAGPLNSTAEAQDQAPPDLLVDLVNSLRLDQGLDPYRRFRLLDAAAQRHADDLAAGGFADPDDPGRGSDGTSAEDRIREAGYLPWTAEEQMVVGENVWVGQGTPGDVLASSLEDPSHGENLLSEAYREFGVGFATDHQGQAFYVLVFGSRPNVLPIFINDGAVATENREVAIRLTNERVRPGGSGTAFMGEAIEIRVSDEPTFEGLSWRPWAPLVSWTLADRSGDQTVYVQFRDAGGRTAAAADSIFLDTGTPQIPPMSETATPQLAVSPSPDLTATEVPTAPDPELTPEDVIDPPDAALERAAETVAVTPFPTWTPLPSPEPTSGPPEQSAEADGTPASPADYTRPLVLVGILQGAALCLGIYLMIRRGGISARE